MMGDNADKINVFISQLAWQIHPELGRLYDEYQRFWNDALVELLCLIITNVFIGILSYNFIGFSLVILITLTATPITFLIKFFMHKKWVWK